MELFVVSIFQRAHSLFIYCCTMILYYLHTLSCSVIGTRCDDYTYKLITGKERSGSCHTYLTEAVKKHGLTEQDVHDVWNIFMCTGFTKVRSDLCGW